jgi:dienelactone hydrolase
MRNDDRDWDDSDWEQSPRRSGKGSKKSGWLWWLFGILGGVGVLGVLCCGGGVWAVRSFLSPTSFPEQTEDYADARAKFRTRLTVQGPAPQSWQREAVPPGVQETEYLSGSLRLKAWVNKPMPAGAPKPAVLFLHGGFAFGADDWDQAKPFRDAGFVTMLPILRGENGLPGSFSMFYDEVDDVLAAAEALGKTPGVDTNRMYVSGHSAGGTFTMLAAMTSTRFKAAASFSGSPDQLLIVRGREKVVPFDLKNQRELQMRSPLAYPKSFKCPVRIYYGSQETLLKSSCEKTAELAQAAGLDVQAVSVQGDHDTSVPPAMRQAITFFQQKK